MDIDNEDEVVYMKQKIPFAHARKFCFIEFLNTSWAIADIISNISGQLLLHKKQVINKKFNPKLTDIMFTDHFPFSLSELILENYGYAISVSYTIRNLFVHTSGILEDGNFFEVESSSDQNFRYGKFNISAEGRKLINSKIDIRARSNYIRNQSVTINVEKENLLELLTICEKEIDLALSLLIITSTEFEKNQAQLQHSFKSL